jgi:Mn2+/Fe2+ NRAMP family transporter
MSVNNNNQEAAKSREQFKKVSNSKPDKVGRRRIRVRIIPIWLRVIIVAVLIFLSVIAGAAVGYGIVGDGSAKDVLKKSTWTHIIDLIEKE